MTTTKKKVRRKKKVPISSVNGRASKGVPGKQKKKVRRKKVKGVRRKSDLDTAASAKRKISPAERIQVGGRGFKLGFGGLPTQRKLSDKQREAVNKKDKKVAERMLKQAKSLFDRHPAITAVSSAKGAIQALFDLKTLPFPDPGVRLFMLETADIDFEKMAEDEINARFAQQIEVFSLELQEKIAEYDAAVLSLQKEWADVLQAAKEALEDLYDEGDYPTAEQLPEKLACHFRPYNIDLPKEYGYVSPVERQRALAVVQKQYEEAVTKQEEFVVKLLNGAITDMIESINGVHTGEKKVFKNSRVERVFDAFREFKEKTIRYGILEGTALEAEFKRAISFMREGGHGEDTLPGSLRKSPEKRADLMEKMEMVRSSIEGLAEKRKRRSIRRD